MGKSVTQTPNAELAELQTEAHYSVKRKRDAWDVDYWVVQRDGRDVSGPFLRPMEALELRVEMEFGGTS